MSENNEPVKLKQTSVALVVILTAITGGIYFPIWFLNRRKEFNKLHSKEKLGKGIYIFGIICFSVVTLLGFYSGFSAGINQAQNGSDMKLTVNYIDLVANIIALIVLVPFIHQTFKVKRILLDHYNGYLKRNIKFSNVLTFLLLNIYLQYKINKLEQ